MNESGVMSKEGLSKRIVEQRVKQGFSQEALADLSGLSLRTIQRVEKGESIPRGRTLKKLAHVLNLSAEELIDLDLSDDPNMLVLLNLSQLSCLLFPLLGLIAPLLIWIVQRNRTQYVNDLGVCVLNFQLLWNLLVFAVYGVCLMAILVSNAVSTVTFHFFVASMAVLYLYVLTIAVYNSVLSHQRKRCWYKPVIPLLR
ncbi:helix-turn-helix domain-containing protein [Agaribacterium sp. ZY112]|uniref:helix-turn-helix domain-containing protein n=1 Tax=Agaribacterium sp. ZY112 TaxID=3233574 RepID=UPI003523A6EA